MSPSLSKKLSAARITDSSWFWAAIVAVILAVVGVVGLLSPDGTERRTVDFSERVHRDVVDEPGSTDPAVIYPEGDLYVELETETITLHGRNNAVVFEVDATEEDPFRFSNQVQWIQARSSGHSAEETKVELRRRVALAGQTVDWDQVDAWIDHAASGDGFYPQTVSVVETSVDESRWLLDIGLLVQASDDFTIDQVLGPTPEVATRDL